MSDPMGVSSGAEDRLSQVTGYYLMGIAVLLLVAGLVRAGLILGITPTGASFETMDAAARIGAVALALLDFFAAVGLWIRAAWGPHMWAVVVIVETTMYTALSDLFGSHPLLVAMHFVSIGIYLALLVADWRRAVRL